MPYIPSLIMPIESHSLCSGPKYALIVDSAPLQRCSRPSSVYNDEASSLLVSIYPSSTSSCISSGIRPSVQMSTAPQIACEQSATRLFPFPPQMATRPTACKRLSSRKLSSFFIFSSASLACSSSKSVARFSRSPRSMYFSSFFMWSSLAPFLNWANSCLAFLICSTVAWPSLSLMICSGLFRDSQAFASLCSSGESFPSLTRSSNIFLVSGRSSSSG
mmetsp:Transcript_16839/g.36562  ORF Transcript_16839/g.36562 Transcript_16839/m.36562 type:complete len:218 (+) Transcript_16839:966-1619(+)